MFDPKYIQSRLDYDPLTGILTWKQKPVQTYHDKSWNSKWAGKPALTAPTSKGYCYGHVNNIKINAHLAAWLVYYGAYPVHGIDHENGNRKDNKIKNLRDVTRAINNKNKGSYAFKVSGLPTGVFPLGSAKNPYGAKISINGKQKYIGCFPTPEAAHAAYLEKAREHGYSPRHGTK